MSITSWAQRHLWSRRFVTAFRLLSAGQFLLLFNRLRLFILNRLIRKKPPKYSEWRNKWVKVNQLERIQVLKTIEELPDKPLFTFLISFKEKSPELLEKTLKSLVNQLYVNWKVEVLALDSQDHSLISSVNNFDDNRVSISKSESEIGKGWVCKIDPGVILHEAALFTVTSSIRKNQEALIIYSDHDHISETNCFIDPYMKPDLNPDLLKGTNYLAPFVIFKDTIWEKYSDYHSNLHDLSIAATNNLSSKKVIHLPHVLASIQVGRDRSYLLPEMREIEFPVPEPLPLVSILIPTKNQGHLLESCLNSLVNETSYPNFEVIVIDHESTEEKAKKVIENFDIMPNSYVLPFTGQFNFSAMMNHASSVASGEILVLLNNDTEIIESNWLTEMVRQVTRPEVGVVGALLFFANGNIQHAGVTPGVDAFMGHSHKNWSGKSAGYFGRLRVAHDVAAVTGACLAIKVSTWNSFGGLDENLAVAYNDIDLCMRARKAGLKVIIAPKAKLTHHESISRGFDDKPEEKERLIKELEIMKDKWGDSIFEDIAYSTNLSLEGKTFVLSETPRVTPPWQIN